MTTKTREEAPLLLRTLEQVELARLADNPWQPRAQLDPEQVKELADSIEQVGLLQPPLARPFGDGYQIAFGHYRIAALRLLGLAAVELEVRQLSDAEMAIIALSENTKRRHVAPIEQYRAWQKALEIEGMTIAMLADSLGFDRSTVSNNLRLLKLPAWVLEHVDAGDLSAHAAREFLCLMGSDGHFHESEARQVMEKLTTGSPDWRTARVRREIDQAVCGRSVSEWRRLFTAGHPGGRHASPPAFDIAKFKDEQGVKVHTLPDDEWTASVWRDGNSQLGKVKTERSRDWTCATSAWASRQSAGKKAAEGVAAAAAKTAAPGQPVKSANFVKVLAADPVFQSVSPETAGDLLKAMGKEELDADAAAALGTRAAPVHLDQGKKQFRALVDAHGVQEQYAWQLTPIPSYFPDIEECRKTCIIGATYGRFSDSGALALYCLNKEHFEKKVAEGREAIMRKVERKKVAIDEADERLYAALANQPKWQMPPAVTSLLAAIFVLADTRFEVIRPDNVGYSEAQALEFWPANTERIFALLGLNAKEWFSSSNGLKALAKLDSAPIKELLLRFVVETGRRSSLAPFTQAIKPAK